MNSCLLVGLSLNDGSQNTRPLGNYTAYLSHSRIASHWWNACDVRIHDEHRPLCIRTKAPTTVEVGEY